MTALLETQARQRRSGVPRVGIIVALLAASLAACSRDDAPAADASLTPPASGTSAADSSPVATVDTAAKPAAPACVSEGAWQVCSVEKRLTDAGFVPLKQDGPAADLFPIPGVEYALGPARLHVYVFETAKARERAVATIDTIAIARRGKPATWPAPAWLITSNNLVAVLLSDNARLVERVQLALTAGLPSAAH